MLIQQDAISVLAVDCPMADQATDGTVSVTNVADARAALAALRVVDFNLLVTGSHVGGAPIWPFMHKVRRVRPRLQWWLMGHGLIDAEEVLARSLGVAQILDGQPTMDLFADAINRMGRAVAARRATVTSPGRRVASVAPTCYRRDDGFLIGNGS